MSWYVHLLNVFAQAAPDTASYDDNMSFSLKLAIAVGVLVGSFVLGSLIARALRLPDEAFRIGFVLCTAIAGIAICVLGWPPKLGIDLSGGVVLVYEIDQQQQHSANLEDVIRQLNSGLRSEGVAAEVNAAGMIEVPLRSEADEQRLRERIRSVDENFRFVERRMRGDKQVLVYAIDRQQSAVNMDKMVAAISRRINPSGVKEVAVRQYGLQQLEVIVPEVEQREVELIKKKISTSGMLEFRIVANSRDHKHIINAARQSPAREVLGDDRKPVGRWVKLGKDVGTEGAELRDAPAGGKEILMAIDPYNVDGHYLNNASAGTDQAGQRAVLFSLSSEGGRLFNELTSENLPDPATGFHRRLGIILDGELLSAPVIQSAISTNGQISGRFTEEDVNFLVGVLNAGSLPAALQKEPISQQRISSQLGEDTIQKGEMSMLLSTALVILFMLVYYRFAGFVANIAVLLNMVLAVALMLVIQAAFTLPGLAGLVLTVGMAVDANVLIYERMREESHRGASLRMAIRNGFSKATTTIIDSNLTTLITAAVLYMIGTDQIKGFAVTLFIGLVVSMYTAIYVSRLIFDVAERKRWLTKLRMMQIIRETHWDFVRWLKPALAASFVVIAIGMVAVVARRSDLLDIDFTGGSSVQILFRHDKPHDIAEVRDLLEDLPDVAVSRVGTGDLEYKIDTSERDIQEVQKVLQAVFKDSLRTYAMTYGKLASVEPTRPAQVPSSKPAAPADRAREGASRAPRSPSGRTSTSSMAALTGKVAGVAPASSGIARIAGADRSHTIELALAGPPDAALTALLLAQKDDAPAGSSKPAPTSSKPTGSATEAAADRAPADGTPADRAPARPGSPSATDSTKPAPTAQKATVVALKFEEPISYSALSDQIEQHMAALKLPMVQFDLTNPRYTEGSSAPLGHWTLRIMIPPGQTEQLLKEMKTQLGQTPVFASASQIGGKVAGDTQQMAIYAMLASLLMIVIYVWVRFQNVIFGVAAVVALIHDVLVTLGFLALSYYLAPSLGFLLIDPFKISLAVVAALLTIVGFSINDTIVIFDRIREVRGKSPDLTAEMINLSVNQTMSRTILTTGTVLISTIILYIAGGKSIHPFAYAMLVGLISGTYSTVYIASPLLLLLRRKTSSPSYRQPAISTSRTAKSA